MTKRKTIPLFRHQLSSIQEESKMDFEREEKETVKEES